MLLSSVKTINVVNLFLIMREIKINVKRKTQFAYESELACERLFSHNGHDHPSNLVLLLTTDRQVKMEDNWIKVQRCFLFSTLLSNHIALFFF